MIFGGSVSQKLGAASQANPGQEPPFFMAVGLHKPHIPWVMPQRFLDVQIPVDQIDIATRDVPPVNYCNASLCELSHLTLFTVHVAAVKES